MQIDLRECETLVINLAKDEARRARMAELCNRLQLDYRFIDAIEASPRTVGIGLTHIKALKASRNDRPLLLLEDDLADTEDYRFVVTIPDDADALYVGTSNFGAFDEVYYIGFTNCVAADIVSDDLARTYNMLGAHAILYLTERYKKVAVDAMLTAMVEHNWDPDRGLAKIQGEFDVYALRRPMLYQAAAAQNSVSHGELQEFYTKRPLQIAPVGTPVRFFSPEGEAFYLRLIREDGRVAWKLFQPGPEITGHAANSVLSSHTQ